MAGSLPGDVYTRKEKDTMGTMDVPETALWGASTQRAVLNFPVSGLRMPRSFIRSLGLIKAAAAKSNSKLGIIPDDISEAIVTASISVAEGEHDEHFPIDVFQTGSGTSSNMNANEVIARLASKDSGLEIHPNDHVNQGQSSNDVIPSAIHLSALFQIQNKLIPQLVKLQNSLTEKSNEFHDIVKTGRTHLMDATPIRLGQEFEGYAGLIERSIDRLILVQDELSLLALGGTAVGTGVNTHSDFSALTCAFISELAGVDVHETDNHFLAQSTLDGALAASSVLRGAAVSMQKIANDIRWLGSGPRAGISELQLPAVQPGSSIMPGKVNPVIPEALIQACSQVIACDSAMLQAAQGGYFELNTMLPFAAHNILQSINLLTSSSAVFDEKCIQGIEATSKGPELLHSGLMLATALAPVIGYVEAAKIAKEAHSSGKTVIEVAEYKTDLSREELEEILDPSSMLEPNTSEPDSKTKTP
ncbi:MAG: aspartate ammonia-lyase [Marine Group III euryarchaeote CG-Bathy1]|uniref:Fumarate hydratase class II n=1 Tax=Marine Group III euryarchaeote CG-Bathy1 TaxID=1889001 RepID=A0A1J5TXC6_9ARCH|nr:MAG: aspartate ammonia-lyase [Marine Group III euryarchaeote CG-Bathy1]